MEPRINPGGETINHNLKNYIVNHPFYLETKIFCPFIYFSFLMKDFIIFILFDIVVFIFSDIAKWRWALSVLGMATGRGGTGDYTLRPRSPKAQKSPSPPPIPGEGIHQLPVPVPVPVP